MMRLAFVAVAIGAVCAEIVNLNENNFKELVESDTSDSIWLLDFYAVMSSVVVFVKCAC